MPERSKQSLEAELTRLRSENRRLRKENQALRKEFGPVSRDAATVRDEKRKYAGVTNQSTVDKKIRLFRSLFLGREDVYPVRWENRKGRIGYSPACGNEWHKTLCRKPKIKCGACPNSQFLAVTDTVIHDHLTGKKSIGVYPILEDGSCRFLAVDFDKTSWHDDARAFTVSSTHLGIPAYVERSRSGNGAHVWIFFSHAVRASLARKLGSLILTHATSERPGIGLESYDRLFPGQDTVPTGGFGNLIALPLQKRARELGNSEVLNTSPSRILSATCLSLPSWFFPTACILRNRESHRRSRIRSFVSPLFRIPSSTVLRQCGCQRTENHASSPAQMIMNRRSYCLGDVSMRR